MNRVDLRERFLPIWDQDGLNACMALVLSDLIWWDHQQQEPQADTVFSALFLYYNARKLAGHENYNVAVRPSEAMNSVHEFGVCSESFWPYEPGRYRERPPDSAYHAAKTANGVTFEPLIQELDGLRTSLDEERPFLFCIRLFPSNSWDFDHGATAAGGKMTMPQPGESVVRNHALLAVGYDDDAGTILARNTLGKAWGQRGHVTIPFDYILNSSMTYAFWRTNQNGSAHI